MTYSGTKGVVEAYNPNTDTWIKKADMITPRTSISGCVVKDKIIAIGGSLRPGGDLVATVEMYDPKSDTWSQIQDLSVQRAALVSASVKNRMLAIGGSTNNWPFTPVGMVEEYIF